MARKKLTCEEVKKIIELESNGDCCLLSETYNNSKEKLKILCKCSSTYFCTLTNFMKSQKQCKRCGIELRIKQKRESIEEVRKVVSDGGCELISKEYLNNHTKLKFKCKCGNVFESTLLHFKKGKKQCNECSQRSTHEWREAEKIFYSYGYSVYEPQKYKSIKTNLDAMDKDGYKYKICLDRIRNNIKPRRFHVNNPFTIENIKLWMELEMPEYELLSDEYTHNSHKLELKCDKGHLFNTSWNDLKDGHLCSTCYGNKKLSNSDFDKRLIDLYNGEYERLSGYKNFSKKIKLLHNKCATEYYTTPSVILRGFGCPSCNESKGEKQISKWLETSQISYKPQITFDGLIGVKGGNLSYDFYLPELNILIEYQGQYHDGTVSNQTEEDFKKQQEHDRRKREYANDHNIKLLEIWYWDFDNIETILNNYITQAK